MKRPQIVENEFGVPGFNINLDKAKTKEQVYVYLTRRLEGFRDDPPCNDVEDGYHMAICTIFADLFLSPKQRDALEAENGYPLVRLRHVGEPS